MEAVPSRRSNSVDLIVEDVDADVGMHEDGLSSRTAKSAMQAPVGAAPSLGIRASRRMSGVQSTSSTQSAKNVSKVNEVWTDVMPATSDEAEKDLRFETSIDNYELSAEESSRRTKVTDSEKIERFESSRTSRQLRKMPRLKSAHSMRLQNSQVNGAKHQADQKPVFADAAAMKKKLREAILKPKYSVFDYYKKEGIAQYVARHQFFEVLTLAVIASNAIYMAVDADHNHADILNQADWPFQVAEHFFCTYFLLEWLVRFGAFEIKADGLKDRWFVFDTSLLVLSVAETWAITVFLKILDSESQSNILPTPMLRLLRLLRLMRMARMAKILKELPELMILIKGMSMATRSVFFTCCLLIILIYVFAIGFTGLLRNTAVGSEFFSDVGTSMITLALYGTLLDEITSVAYLVGEESVLCSILLAFFILVAALTVMNMLIGVLCEVVNAVAAVERDELVVMRLHEQLKVLFDQQGLDMNGDGQIDRSEFEKILEIPQAARALQDVGVDVVGLVDFAEVIFEGDPCSEEGERQLSFSAFMEVVLQLRGGNTATVKDIVDCRKSIMQHNERLVDNLYASLVDHVGDQHEILEPQPKVKNFSEAATPSASASEAVPVAASHVDRPTAITLNIPQEPEDTGGTKDLRSVEDLLTGGLQEIQRIQAKSLSLEESLTAGLDELRAVRRRTEGLQDVFVRGLNEVRRAR